MRKKKKKKERKKKKRGKEEEKKRKNNIQSQHLLMDFTNGENLSVITNICLPINYR